MIEDITEHDGGGGAEDEPDADTAPPPEFKKHSSSFFRKCFLAILPNLVLLTGAFFITSTFTARLANEQFHFEQVSKAIDVWSQEGSPAKAIQILESAEADGAIHLLRVLQDLSLGSRAYDSDSVSLDSAITSGWLRNKVTQPGNDSEPEPLPAARLFIKCSRALADQETGIRFLIDEIKLDGEPWWQASCIVALRSRPLPRNELRSELITLLRSLVADSEVPSLLRRQAFLTLIYHGERALTRAVVDDLVIDGHNWPKRPLTLQGGRLAIVQAEGLALWKSRGELVTGSNFGSSTGKQPLGFELILAGHISDCSFLGASFESTHVRGRSTLTAEGVLDSRATGVSLEGARVISCKFSELTMESAIFRETIVRRTVFEDCELMNVDWQGDPGATSLSDVVFRNCKLRWAQFTNATLTDVAFYNCDLRDANFSSTEVTHLTICPECLLSNATFRGSSLSASELKKIEQDHPGVNQ